jgi:hypothetical protein
MGRRPNRGLQTWARRLVVGTLASFVITGATSLPVSGGVPPNPRIFTAVSDTSNLRLQSGFRHYLYVAGTSAGALMTASSFQYDEFTCGTTSDRIEPIGRSMPMSNQATFTTDGDVSALGGVAISGDSVKLIDRGPGAFLCGNVPSGSPMGYQTGWSTGSVGGSYLILVGTEGSGSLTDMHFQGGADHCHAGPIKTLQNVTADNGTDAGSVGIFTAHVGAHSTCGFDVSGPVVDGASGASFAAMWANVYLLTPTTR